MTPTPTHSSQRPRPGGHARTRAWRLLSLSRALAVALAAAFVLQCSPRAAVAQPPPEQDATGDSITLAGLDPFAIGEELFRSFCASPSGTLNSSLNVCVPGDAGDIDNATLSPAYFGYDHPRNSYIESEKNPCVGDKAVRPDDLGKEGDLCTIEDLVIVPDINEFHLNVQMQRAYQRYLSLGNSSWPAASNTLRATFISRWLGSPSATSTTPYFSTSSCILRCASGLECSPDNLALAIESGLGNCKPCADGQFCPDGTMNDGGKLVGTSSMNLCPPGYFCPDPSVAYNCPAGYFCPAGSLAPYKCSDIETGGIKLIGNLCEENSANPWGLCPPGFYCPNATFAIECPEGYSCRPQSLAPQPCPMLTDCPPGSKRPEISLMWVISMVCLAAGLALLLGAYALVLRLAQRKVLKSANDSGRQARLLRAIGTKLGLSSEQMAYASNLTGFSENLSPVNISADHLNVRMSRRRKSKLVVNDVSIQFKSGTLNAVLGSSGAGKTTFLKALVGKFADNAMPSGRISYQFVGTKEVVHVLDAPEPAKPGRKRRRRCCGGAWLKHKARENAVALRVAFVAQENIVHELLTVYENISYSARLRLGSRLPKQTKARVVQDTITVLGLNHIQNAKVGNPLSAGGSISGGEARRVSIGLELCACPGLIILDEPTSGLDAVSSNDVMTCLSKMSDLGVTVMASMHQPRYSTFALFDRIHLFLTGGHVAFSGTAAQAADYFEACGFVPAADENPCDFYIDVLSGLIKRPGDDAFVPADLIGMWRARQRAEAAAKGFHKRSKPGHRPTKSDLSCVSSRAELLPSSDNIGSSSAEPFGMEQGLNVQQWLSLDDTCLSRKTSLASSYANESDFGGGKSWQKDDLHVDSLASNGRSGTLRRKKTLQDVFVNTPLWLEALGEQFDALDVDKKGYLDGAQMLQVLQSMGQRCTLEDAKVIVDHFDVDGDGKIAKRDFMLRWTQNYWTREFSAALLSMFPPGTSLPSARSRSASAGRPVSRKQSVQMASLDEHEIDWDSLGGEDGVGQSRRFAGPLVGGSSPASSTDGFCYTFWTQLATLVTREPLMWFRSVEIKIFDLASMLALAIGYAFVLRGQGSIFYSYTLRDATRVAMLIVGLLSAFWCCFFLNRGFAMFARETSQGVSVGALFLAKILFEAVVDLPLRTLTFALPFYYVTGWRMPFGEFFLVTYGVSWSTGAIGQLASSMTRDTQSSVVFSVAVAFLFGSVLNGTQPTIKELRQSSNPLLLWMVQPSYNRWATEALVVREGGLDDGVASYELKNKLERLEFGYDDANWTNALIFLFVSGVGVRLVAFAFLYHKAMR